MEVDAIAKDLAIDIINQQTKTSKFYPHPFSFPTCRWNQVIIHQQLSNGLYKHNIYWNEKGRVCQDQLKLLDTNAMEKGTKSMSLNMKRFVAGPTVSVIL